MNRGGRVVVIDFGAQYAQLICRKIREAGVYAELVAHDAPRADWDGPDVAALVLSGGPGSVHADDAPSVPVEWLAGRPVLGICYGMQLMAHLLGGRTETAAAGEYGRATVAVADAAGEGLFAGLAPQMDVWMSHGDRVLDVPPGFRVTARSEHGVVAAMGDPARDWYGLQFHPEVAHTPQGPLLLRNFLFGICGLAGDWTPASFIDEAIDRIQTQVGNGRAVVALSGGVDSMVAAALVHRAIGDHLTAVFVDHGLLRAGEAAQVERLAAQALGLPLRVARAQDAFLAALAGVTDPEEKRRIIGRLFIEAFEREIAALDAATAAAETNPADRIGYLVQGTLYPDVIESGRGAAHVIKTHHNVGGLPPEMRLQLVEPLRDLFKDEVRRVGVELGLPEEAVQRQPFPGPGLAVRMLGAVTPDRLETLRRADFIVREEVQRAGLDRELWQWFAVLTGAYAVGVKGDRRAYGEAVALRAVRSDDAMTAQWAVLPADLLGRISERITREVPACTRVVYDITSKPPGTIEWE